MKAKIIKLNPEVELPKYHTDESAGFDIASSEDRVIAPGELALIRTGLVIQAPKKHFLLLSARSSLPIKKKLMPANGIGIIDRDYCGNDDEIKLELYNFGTESVSIAKGERLMQGMFIKFDQCKWEEASQIKQNSRGGFGSTAGYQ